MSKSGEGSLTDISVDGGLMDIGGQARIGDEEVLVDVVVQEGSAEGVEGVAVEAGVLIGGGVDEGAGEGLNGV